MIKPEAKVYSRGKVIPDREFLQSHGLILNKDGKIVHENSNDLVDPDFLIKGVICVLDDADKPVSMEIEMVPRSFPSWFVFGDCSSSTGCKVTITAKVQINRKDCK